MEYWIFVLELQCLSQVLQGDSLPIAPQVRLHVTLAHFDPLICEVEQLVMIYNEQCYYSVVPPSLPSQNHSVIPPSPLKTTHSPPSKPLITQ